VLTYTHPSKEDLPQLDSWVASDPDHVGKSNGKYWINEPDKDGNVAKGVQCVKVTDDKGVVFYLKFTNTIMVDAQFSPDTSEEEKERIRKGLKEAFQFFYQALKKQGYHAMLFDSVSPTLVRFFGRFGFKRLTNFFKVGLL
jgi:hypothetical protein